MRQALTRAADIGCGLACSAAAYLGSPFLIAVSCCWPTSKTNWGGTGSFGALSNSTVANALPSVNISTVTAFDRSGEVPETIVPSEATGAGCGGSDRGAQRGLGCRQRRGSRRGVGQDQDRVADLAGAGLVAEPGRNAGDAIRRSGRWPCGEGVADRGDVTGWDQQGGVVGRSGRRRARCRGLARGRARRR